MIRSLPKSTLFPYTTPSDLILTADSNRNGKLRMFRDSRTEHSTDIKELMEKLAQRITGSLFPWCFARTRSEEHTSELQSHSDLVCRLLLEKKKKINYKEL